MKTAIKQFIETYFPRLASVLHGISGRLHVRRFNRKNGLTRLAKRYLALNGSRVQAGPFAGMNYVREAAGSSFVPKLIGSYESELLPALRRIIPTDYACIVDVGCAEGYYAVGLALRLPRARVIAFDIDRRARKLCNKLAALNGVSDRVTVRSACDPQTLSSALVSRSLVICDCEGYEAVLLDPIAVPELEQADVLVEFHEHLMADCESLIVRRFQATHEVQIFTSMARDPSSIAGLAGLHPEERSLAVNEFRSTGQRWAFLTAREFADSFR